MMKKLLVTVLAALLLVSCAKKNPLIRSDVIQYLKTSGYTWGGYNFPLTDCAAFYAGYISSLSVKHKLICDTWAEDRLTNITNNLGIQNATLKDITDIKLWQLVYPKDKYLK